MPLRQQVIAQSLELLLLPLLLVACSCLPDSLPRGRRLLLQDRLQSIRAERSPSILLARSGGWSDWRRRTQVLEVVRPLTAG